MVDSTILVRVETGELSLPYVNHIEQCKLSFVAVDVSL